MLVSEFDYQLPDERIAQRPRPRGTSRLLVVDAEGPSRHRTIAELPQLLRVGDLLVVNDTRVLPARLLGRREPGGGRLELLLARKLGERTWECLARPGKRARPGTRVAFDDSELRAEVEANAGDGRKRLRFSEPVEPHLEKLGHVPLPPYIDRPDEEADRERYQTIWADVPGAIAAPTAGLHFTRGILAALETRGVGVVQVTLHVGLGTFKPVTVELVHEHRMDAESFVVPAATAEAIARARARGGRVVAVGTTVVRTLESAFGNGAVRAGEGSSELFITPGYRFRAVDLLLTNFHLPRSTLLMLVSAFAGRERVLAAYREAISEGYLFYSYGDAMLVGPDAAEPDRAPRR